MTLWPEFQQFFRLNLADLWTGGLSVIRALVHVEHLKTLTDSRFAATMRGNGSFQGWDDDRAIAAETHNVLVMIAAGLGGKKATPDLLIHAPTPVIPDNVARAATIAEFDVDGFMRVISS